jgi:hypothetical protein
MVSAVIFDLDGTLTGTPNPWRYVHERMGIWDTSHSPHGRLARGRSTYDEFCREGRSDWAGRDISEIHSYLDEIEINRHVPEVVGTLGTRSSFHHHFFRLPLCRSKDSNPNATGNPLLIYANELLAGPKCELEFRRTVPARCRKEAHADSALRIVGARFQDTLVYPTPNMISNNFAMGISSSCT